MNTLKRVITLILICFSFVSTSGFSEEEISLSDLGLTDTDTTSKTSLLPSLSLDQAIMRATQESYPAKTAKMDLEDAEINYKNAWDTMFLPNISLSLASTSSRTLGSVGGTPGRKTPADNKGYPNSSLTLSLANYTLFNFWRDRITYDNARMSYERAEQRYVEQIRSIRFLLTNAYYSAKAAQDRVEIANRSLMISQSILNLVKSQLKLGQATQEDVSSSMTDMNNAQIEVDTAQAQLQTTQYTLNQYLSLPIQNRFNLTTPLPYKPIGVSEDWALYVYKLQSPQIRDAKLALKTAEGNLELAQKNRLPLPTFSISGVSVTYGNSAAPGTVTYAQPSGRGPGGQIEFETAISLTIPLVGSGGFLNSRTVRSSILSQERSRAQLFNTMLSGEVTIRNAITNIKNLESQIKNFESNLENTSSVLTDLVSKIKDKKVSRLELRDAIAQARQSELSKLDAVSSHNSQKISLLELIGKDDFNTVEVEKTRL